MGGTGLISQTRGTTTNYFLQDGQGSTRGLTSTTGTVTDTYSYTAFGESFATTGTTVNPYRYTGQQLDNSTGLYSLRARYYNPTLGRFLSQDTYPVNFGNPVELNRYVYTGNSPINRIDATGQFFETAQIESRIAKAGLAVGAVGEIVSLYYARAGWIVANYLPQLLSLSADQVLDLVGTVQSIVSWGQNLSTSLQTRSQQAPAPTQTQPTETSQTGKDVILELGVGTGSNMVNLGQLFPEKIIVGVDIDEGSINLAGAMLRKAGLDNTYLVHDVWASVRSSIANEVISVAPGGTIAEDILALRAAATAVKPGGRIYIGSVQYSTFGNNELSAAVKSALDILTARGLTYTKEYDGGTGFRSWGYPLLTDYYKNLSSYLIVNVGWNP